MTEDRRDKDRATFSYDADLEDEFGEDASVETSSGAGLEHPDYQGLQEKLTLAEQALHESQDKVLRTLSELENTRRRAEQDKMNAHRYGVQKLCEDLLPVMDSLEQAIMAGKQGDTSDAGLLQGIEMTLQMLLNVLTKYQVVVIDPIGQAFDPKSHEAMSMVESTEVPAGTVMTVFQKGYQLHERVIRPARVVVSKAPQ